MGEKKGRMEERNFSMRESLVGFLREDMGKPNALEATP